MAGLVAITVALMTTRLTFVDLVVRDWCTEHRPVLPYWTARAFNYLGQGGPLSVAALGVVAWLAVRHRTVRPILVWLAAYLLPYLTVGPLKVWTRRGAPANNDLNAVELFSMPACLRPECMSYPSGHVINAIVWYAVLAILLRAYLTPATSIALRVVPAVIVSVTTVYTGFHWLTDTLAGICIGMALVGVIGLINWVSMPLPAWLSKWDSGKWQTRH